MREAISDLLQGIPIVPYAVGYLLLAALFTLLSFGSSQGRLDPVRKGPQQGGGCLQHIALGLMTPGIMVIWLVVLFVLASAANAVFRSALIPTWLLVSGAIYAVRAANHASGGGKWGERLTANYAAAALLYGGLVILIVYWLLNPNSPPPGPCRFAPC